MNTENTSVYEREERPCSTCIHYVTKDGHTGCECWECECEEAEE